ELVGGDFDLVHAVNVPLGRQPVNRRDWTGVARVAYIVRRWSGAAAGPTTDSCSHGCALPPWRSPPWRACSCLRRESPVRVSPCGSRGPSSAVTVNVLWGPTSGRRGPRRARPPPTTAASSLW